MHSGRIRSLALLIALSTAGSAQGQWIGRYPQAANTGKNVGHQPYLEAYNLPTFAASPDRSGAFE